MNLYTALADAVLVIHFAFVAFTVGGFVAIWIGYFAGWPFVRNLTFRIAHLLAMGFVAWQAIADMRCPLTVLEHSLRVRAGQGNYEGSFIEHWLGRILFYDVSPRVLSAVYIAFFLLIVLTLWRVPPRRKREGDCASGRTPRGTSSESV